MGKVKVVKTYDELLGLAKEYGVENNALFLAAARQYDLQMKVIDKMRDAIENGESLTCEKTYQPGEKNTYADPLVKELPRHADSANKTLQTMLDIISKLGKKSEQESELGKFAKEFG